MSYSLNTDPAMRAERPIAISFPDPTTRRTIYLHFDNKRAADFYASLLDTDGHGITRYVALAPTEPLGQGDNGWRVVSWFE